MKNEKFISLKKDYDLKIDNLDKKENQLSLFRLISFMFFLAIFVYGLFINQTLVVFLSLIILAVFMFLVIQHEQLTQQINILKLSKEVCNDYLARFTDEWTNFKDTGLDDFEEENIVLNDLDIIGTVSLFKYLNITKTKGARKLLLSRLSNNNLSSDQLLESQASVKEIAEKYEFSINLQANLKDFANQSFDKDVKQVVKSINDAENNTKVNIMFMTNLLISIFTISSLFISVFNNSFLTIFLGLLVLNLLFSLVILLANKNAFMNISHGVKGVSKLENLYNVIFEKQFNYKGLILKQKDIAKGLASIKIAKQVSTLDSYKNNVLSYVLVNVFFPLNGLIIKKYNKFAIENKDKLLKSIESFEYFELFTSLAIIPQVKQQVCMPVLSNKINLDFANIKHPLINESKSVANSYATNNEVTIITGSNMSGKTSFLRTIGINLILMQAGTFVCATKFEASYLKMFTSMRIKDDISKGISSFYAELLRIKEAIKYQKTNQNMLMLIDEIFRGTNFNDRIDGAIAMIKKLNKNNVILFITTHDLKLCDVDILNKRNYHFSEKYEGDNIKFDYKLKEGRCLTTNAKYLMNLIGIN